MSKGWMKLKLKNILMDIPLNPGWLMGMYYNGFWNNPYLTKRISSPIYPLENYHDNGKPTIRRYISYWNWWFSNVMLVFRGVTQPTWVLNFRAVFLFFPTLDLIIKSSRTHGISLPPPPRPPALALVKGSMWNKIKRWTKVWLALSREWGSLNLYIGILGMKLPSFPTSRAS